MFQRKKPLSAREQERAEAEKRRADDAIPPAAGWPSHYAFRVAWEMNHPTRALHHCLHCGETCEISLPRGDFGARSRTFAENHRGCSKPKEGVAP